MKVLHLVDDEKFIDCVINTFGVLGVESRYVILCSQPFSCGYIKQLDRVDQVVVGSDEYNRLLSDDWPDYIWVHLLGPKKADFVARQTSRARVIWSSWGADNYSLVPIPLFLPETFRQWVKMPYGGSRLGWIKIFLRELRILRLFPVLPRYLLSTKSMRQFLKKVSYFSTIVEGEERFVGKLLSRHAKCIKFAYTDLLNQGVAPSDSDSPCQTVGENVNIWVGNSATWTNNTFDAIKKITRLSNVGNVYAPLSYGDASKAINDYGLKVLGEKWKPLMDFVPLDEYRKKINSCRVFIFNHLRQQAVGNVSLALASGGCVFLQKSNPVYEHFLHLGAKLYAFEDLDSLQSIVLSHEQFADHNKEIVRNLRMSLRGMLEDTMLGLDKEIKKNECTI